MALALTCILLLGAVTSATGAITEALPDAPSGDLPNTPVVPVSDPTAPYMDYLTRHLALVTIPTQGARPVVNVPVPESMRFDLVIDLPYLAGAASLGNEPGAFVFTANEAGLQTAVPAQLNIQDDPASAEMEGGVSLFFAQVDYIRRGSYALVTSWEPNATYSFNPTDLDGIDMSFPQPGLTVTNPQTMMAGTSPGGGSGGAAGSGGGSGGSSGGGSSGGGGCTGRTNVGAGISNSAGTASTSTSGGNIWKTYSTVNLVLGISWWGNCNPAGPGSYWTGTGYASSVRGPNQPAKGGSYLMDIAVAHKGGGDGYGSSDGFGWKNVNVMPSVQLGKPSQGKIALESSTVLGYNKQSCTTWPQLLQDALAVVPTSYSWSVVAYFATRTYCATNWQSLDAGSSSDRSSVGFKITKNSLATQYEDGGRITFRTVATGQFSMPFTYSQYAYGTVTAHGNPSASFTVNAPVTTSSMPAAQVV